MIVRDLLTLTVFITTPIVRFIAMIFATFILTIIQLTTTTVSYSYFKVDLFPVIMIMMKMVMITLFIHFTTADVVS
jgi:hypothetical protein